MVQEENKFKIEGTNITAKLFKAKSFELFKTSIGDLHLKFLKDKEGKIFENANGFGDRYTREGKVIILCQEDNQKYIADYFENGEYKNDMSLFDGGMILFKKFEK